MVNQLLLSGVICRQPIRKQSPSGIIHCLFVLKHRSQQQEAGYWRQAWCRMEVIISGHHADEMLTNQLTAGSQVEVRGFLSNSQGHRGLNRLVLHAKSVKLTYSGE
ncbi:MAG: primosomal replication protein N [Candidatus Symbiodolus clandestinus]